MRDESRVDTPFPWKLPLSGIVRVRAQLREEIRRDAQLHLSALETSTLLFPYLPDPYFLEETSSRW